MFEGLFSSSSLRCIDYLKDPKAYTERIQKMHDAEAIDQLSNVYSTLFVDRPSHFGDCVKWARNHWQEASNENSNLNYYFLIVMNLMFDFVELSQHNQTAPVQFSTGPVDQQWCAVLVRPKTLSHATRIRCQQRLTRGLCVRGGQFKSVHVWD